MSYTNLYIPSWPLNWLGRTLSGRTTSTNRAFREIPQFFWNTNIYYGPNIIYKNVMHLLGHAVAQWLRHYSTNRKVAGSIPDGVIGIFHWHNPSGRTMILGSTQPLTEMSTRNIFWGKGGRCVGLTTLSPSCADWLKIWEPQPPGTLRACPGL
jgi:hypothetical protein